MLLDTVPPETGAAAVRALHAQAALVRDVNELGDLPDGDRERVRVAYEKRFGVH